MKFELQSIAYKVSVDKILFRSLFLSAFSLQANDSMERRPHPPWRMRSCRSRSCLFGRSFNPGEDKRSAVNVVVVVIHREVGAYRPVAGAPSPPPTRGPGGGLPSGQVQSVGACGPVAPAASGQTEDAAKRVSRKRENKPPRHPSPPLGRIYYGDDLAQE